ncbi:hypothetical protein M3J09_013804 [Ascochyta lentis]
MCKTPATQFNSTLKSAITSSFTSASPTFRLITQGTGFSGVGQRGKSIVTAAFQALSTATLDHIAHALAKNFPRSS